MWQGTHPIAPSGRELSPQVTEGASGGVWLWFALGVVLARGYQRPNFHRSNDTGLWRGSNDSQKATVRNCQRRLAADTGRVREVTTCISYRAKLTPEALRALASGAFLSCSGKKGSKEAGLRGEQLAPARIIPPLRIPRVEPSGIDPSLWLGCGGSAPAPVLVCGFWSIYFPRCRLKVRKSPVSHNKTIPGGSRK